MATCPHCGGKGEVFAFVNARPRHYAGNIQCRECGGTGQITEAHAERKEIAKRMWRERIALLAEGNSKGAFAPPRTAASSTRRQVKL